MTVDHEDMEWARDLFDGARSGEEPVWTADTAAIVQVGDRRRRVLMLGTGGGVLGVVAVTAAVAVGLNGTGVPAAPIPAASSPKPGKPIDVSTLFDFVQTGSWSDKVYEPPQQHLVLNVPQAAAEDAVAILRKLDSSGTHIWSARGSSTAGISVVSDDDPKARNLSMLEMGGTWTADGVGKVVGGKPAAEFQIVFTADSAGMTAGGFGNGACGSAIIDAPVALRGKVSWSTCQSTYLPDGSKVGTATARVGAGTMTAAIREFPGDRGGIEILAQDFQNSAMFDKGGTPDASQVVKPSPWSEQLIAAALSDRSLKIGLTTDAQTAPPAQFLQPSDLGSGFTFNAAGSHGTADELQMMNGCDSDKSIFNLPPGRVAEYDGTAPGGAAVKAMEMEEKLKAGTGASTMALAKNLASHGCGDYAKDTVVQLPSGIGDDAYVETQFPEHGVRIVIRFGDTIVTTFFATPDGKTTPELKSVADQDWLTHVARQVAARWTAKS